MIEEHEMAALMRGVGAAIKKHLETFNSRVSDLERFAKSGHPIESSAALENTCAKKTDLEDHTQIILSDFLGLEARIKLLEKNSGIPAAGVKDSQELEARVAKLESRPLIQYRGIWESGVEYQRGNLVTHNGSMFFCWHDTRAKPGESEDFQLCVKRGRDGKDAR